MRRGVAAALVLLLGPFLLAMLLAILLPPVRAADGPAALRPEVLRPDAGAGPTRVGVGVWLADVSRIDSAAQTFSASVFIALDWKDQRLAHGQPGVRSYSLKDIWTPNWMVVNAAGKLEPSLPEIAQVAGDGTVYFRQRLIGTFVEPLDLRAFPFDSATFGIRFVAIGHRPADLLFVPTEAMVAAGLAAGSGIAPQLTLQDWRVTGHSARDLPYRLAPGLETAGYVFEFRAERLREHYILKVIVPLLLIVMMSWTVFWIDRSMGNSQISVAVTSMLTLIAYRFAVGSEVPKLPYLTNLDAFLLVSTAMVFLALIEVVATTALWQSGRKPLAAAIDRHCRVLFPAGFVVANLAILLR